MKRSAISWCDYSGGDLNFVTGCTPVSEGCQNCYARAIYKRFGKDFSRVTTHPDKLERLLKTDFGVSELPGREGQRPICFVCDTGDLLHPAVPDGFIEQAFNIMAARYQVIWVVLTKRPERLYGLKGVGANIKNVWVGVTAENQGRADERIPMLLDVWWGMTFVSVEPMLEPIDLRAYLGYNTQVEVNQDGQRGMSVRSGSEGRVAHRRSGPDMEATPGDMDTRGAPVATRIFANAENAERHSANYGSASSGMEAFQWADCSGAYDQSQKRNERRQSPGESGGGHLLGEHDPCVSDGAQDAMGRNKSGCEDQRCGYREDSQNLCRGQSDPGESGRTVWGSVPDNLRYCPGESAADAARASGGLCEEEKRARDQKGYQGTLSLVICGAESGPHRRPFDPTWAEDLYDQCTAAGVSFFAKQSSALRPGAPLLIHGREVKEWPT